MVVTFQLPCSFALIIDFHLAFNIGHNKLLWNQKLKKTEHLIFTQNTILKNIKLFLKIKSSHTSYKKSYDAFKDKVRSLSMDEAVNSGQM